MNHFASWQLPVLQFEQSHWLDRLCVNCAPQWCKRQHQIKSQIGNFLCCRRLMIALWSIWESQTRNVKWPQGSNAFAIIMCMTLDFSKKKKQNHSNTAAVFWNSKISNCFYRTWIAHSCRNKELNSLGTPKPVIDSDDSVWRILSVWGCWTSAGLKHPNPFEGLILSVWGCWTSAGLKHPNPFEGVDSFIRWSARNHAEGNLHRWQMQFCLHRHCEAAFFSTETN